jgi:hypothetical protein
LPPVRVRVNSRHTIIQESSLRGGRRMIRGINRAGLQAADGALWQNPAGELVA